MKRKNTMVGAVFLFSLVLAWGVLATAAFAEGTGDVGEILSGLRLTGGISGGYFYVSNPGEDTSGSEFLLSNLLVEISSKDEVLPIGFTAAYGETSTPSVLDAPENNKRLGIEYAGIVLKPTSALTVDMGLLGPNSGFENTYTFENENILLGAVASQQPYNAYGAKFGYEAGGLTFWGGYYKDRLDEEEYDSPADAWELGVGGDVYGNEVSLYHYHVGGFRYLTGVVVERTIEGMDVGVNVDYWTWASDMKDLHGSDSALGGAFYINQHFGDFSIPLRIEYIRQNGSGIYIENPDTDGIFSVVITPTYHFSENAYGRAEVSYVAADDGFADESGAFRDTHTGLAVEFGIIF